MLDTNIFISAFFWEGKEREILKKARKKQYQLILSAHIVKEIKGVLKDKFDAPQIKIETFIRDILIVSDVVFPKGNIDCIKEDPSDNYILETALLGKANFIISGDRHLLKLNPWRGIKIIQASKFLG